jgi:hypothetical protein
MSDENDEAKERVQGAEALQELYGLASIRAVYSAFEKRRLPIWKEGKCLVSTRSAARKYRERREAQALAECEGE